MTRFLRSRQEGARLAVFRPDISADLPQRCAHQMDSNEAK
jgi:hypothetical protein